MPKAAASLFSDLAQRVSGLLRHAADSLDRLAPSPDPQDAPGGPPAHWRAVVAQHAPHLLEPANDMLHSLWPDLPATSSTPQATAPEPARGEARLTSIEIIAPLADPKNPIPYEPEAQFSRAEAASPVPPKEQITPTPRPRPRFTPPKSTQPNSEGLRPLTKDPQALAKMAIATPPKPSIPRSPGHQSARPTSSGAQKVGAQTRRAPHPPRTASNSAPVSLPSTPLSTPPPVATQHAPACNARPPQKPEPPAAIPTPFAPLPPAKPARHVPFLKESQPAATPEPDQTLPFPPEAKWPELRHISQPEPRVDTALRKAHDIAELTSEQLR